MVGGKAGGGALLISPEAPLCEKRVSNVSLHSSRLLKIYLFSVSEAIYFIFYATYYFFFTYWLRK